MINPLLLLLLRFSHCSFNHMTYKNRSCNTSYSARNRCDRINDWLNCRIINITTKLALCIDIDTNIDNSLSLSDIISADNTSTTSCNDDDIRLFCNRAAAFGTERRAVVRRSLTGPTKRTTDRPVMTASSRSFPGENGFSAVTQCDLYRKGTYRIKQPAGD